MAGFRVRRSPYMKLGPVRVRRGIVYRAAREADQRKQTATRTTRSVTNQTSARAPGKAPGSATSRATNRATHISAPTAAAGMVQAKPRTWLQARWYENETGHTTSWAYLALSTAEQDRSAARAWGWESAPPHLQWKRVSSANKPPKREYVVTFSRTPSAAAAAEVKRHWERAGQAASRLTRALDHVRTTLSAVQAAVEAARTAEASPIALETHLCSALRQLTSACAALARAREQVASHYDAAHNAQDGITTISAVIQEMRLPSADEVASRIQQHRAGDTQERSQAERIAPALSAQEQVVSAVQQWQVAVRRRWLAQCAYLPVEHWWERLLARLGVNPRRTPASVVSREAVLTQVLRADEVGPDDDGWRQAEAEVVTTEAVLLEAITARDVALVGVAQAFAVTL